MNKIIQKQQEIINLCISPNEMKEYTERKQLKK